MTNDKFLMLNLEDDNSKHIANVISSETSKKILNLLSEKSLSETDIANKLNIPLNTVHYNVQQLLKSSLIEVKDFLWSEKGKKIQYYQLSNKLIIIAPKNNSENFINKLKEILPVFIFGSIFSLGIYIYQKYWNVLFGKDEAIQMMWAPAKESAVAITSAPAASRMMQITNEPNYALWFFSGLLFFLIVYLFYNYFRKRR